MIPVSAVVITKNEERSIERCLESLEWVDEIVVVDAESEDRTQELCKNPSKSWSQKTQVFSRKWSGFRDQRNFALDQTKNDWCLVLDADETCSPELKDRITTLTSQPAGPPFSAYKIRRVEYFLKRPIEHGIWNPSYQDRFFHKKGVRYTNNIHEYPVFPKPPQKIHEPIFHSPEFNPERFLDKMNRYTSIEAMDRVKNGQRTSVFTILTAFPAMFLKNYFYYGAYKDGMHGFVISILEGISRAVRHVKIWQYSRKSE